MSKANEAVAASKDDATQEDDFGLSTWEDVAPEERKYDEPKASYKDIMKLKNGNNIVRIVTNPFVYWQHKYKADPDASGYPDKIKCAMRAGVTCPLCELVDDEGKQRFPRRKQCYLGVIDRKTQSFKVIDAGPGLLQKLEATRMDEEWGDLTTYDINILVNETAGPSNYYTVIPRNKKPLTSADQEIKNSIDLDSLRAKCIPSRPEWVKKRMMLQAKPDEKAEQKVESKAKQETTGPVEDDEYAFPAAKDE